jgi:hypothetical protein
VLQNFRWIRQEERTSYAPNRRFEDDCDPDPYLKGKHKMGPTHTKVSGNFPTPHPANDSGSDDEVAILEVFCSPVSLQTVSLYIPAQPAQTPRSWSARFPYKPRLARSSWTTWPPGGERTRLRPLRPAPAKLPPPSAPRGTTAASPTAGSAGIRCRSLPGKLPVLLTFCLLLEIFLVPLLFLILFLFLS